MTKELNVPIEKPISKEELEQSEEINELIEEIREENKEFLDVVKTKEYLIFYNAIKRALKDITIKVEIINIENISFPREIKSEKTTKKTIKTTSKKDKEEDYILENVKMKFETDKAYLLQDENDQVAWIPKKCMKSLDTIKNIAVIHGWFKEKVQFEEEEPFEP